MPEVLRDYQISDLAFYLQNPRCANLSDPGTGKTPSVCVYMEYLWTKQGCRSFWVMPKSLLRKNRKELLRFTNFTPADVMIIDGTPKERIIQMDSNAKVFLMGFKRFADDWERLKKLHPDMNAVIVDEIHMGFKSHKSDRTKALMKAMRVIEYFLAMSGTLIDGRLDSCFPTVQIIEPRYYGNHSTFMAQHALTDEYGNVILWTNHEKIGRIFKRHCIRRPFNSVYKNSDPIIQTEVCEMHHKQRVAYDEFEASAILELEDKFLEGFNPAVAVMRCRQIMAHPETFGLLKDGELTGKDESLLVHIEDHKNRGNEPMLIYSALVPEQNRIYQLLKKEGLRVGLINGSVSAERRAEIDEEFRAGTLDAIVASPATAAVGFNWGHINHIIFASLDYQDVNFVQAYRRAIRGTREIPLRVTVLEYEDSIDQRIFAIVNKKSSDLAKVDDSYGVLTIGAKTHT